MKNKISNSALDCYLLCGKKYYFQYVEKYKADLTKTPLLFGVAIDNALNYILESIRDKQPWTEDEAITRFRVVMNQWKGQNRLDFFKNEVPEDLIDNFDPENMDHQQAVWKNLVQRGSKLINTYITEVLPLIDEVLHVQYKFNVTNDDEDVFTGVIDFVAKLKDGRTVLFDNKTASAKYVKKAVVQSQQLSFYLDQFPGITLAGYIVLIKNPAKEKGLTHQVLIDTIPEETIQASYDKLDKAMKDIKAGKFEPNYKACKAFGKSCEYEMLCSFGDVRGLIKNGKKEESSEDT